MIEQPLPHLVGRRGDLRGAGEVESHYVARVRERFIMVEYVRK
jgi:hypothetical protein